MNTTSVTFQCPSSGCSNSHTAVVKDSGHDRAETQCYSCGNVVVARTRDGEVVEIEAQ